MGPIIVIVGMLLMIVIHEAGHFVAAKFFDMKATEAFFGTNDFYPFVRAELEQHDPHFYQLVARLWGVPSREADEEEAFGTTAAE